MQQIIHHLEKHSNNSISIEFNGRKKVNPFAASQRFLFTKKGIEHGWHTVELFLKSLKNDGFPSGSKVYLRVPNGSTTKVVGEPITLQFSGDIKNQHMKTQLIQQQAQPHGQSQQLHQSNQPFIGMGNGIMGVHPAESRLDALTSKYEDLKERYDDLKSEYKDLKSSERQLKEVNNSLKLEVNTAEKSKELAILQANLSQKSFMDSEAMKAIATNLAPAIQHVISGQPPQVGMGNSAPQLSTEKKQFIDFIASDKVQDSDVSFVYKVYKHAVQNKAFATGLQGLLTQHNII